MEVTNRLSARRGDELSNGDHKGLQPHACSRERSWGLLAPGSQRSPCPPVPSSLSAGAQGGVRPTRFPTRNCTCPLGRRGFGKGGPWALPQSPGHWHLAPGCCHPPQRLDRRECASAVTPPGPRTPHLPGTETFLKNDPMAAL